MTPSEPEPILAQVPDVVIPAGTELRIRLDQSVSTTRNHPGDRFTGSLVESVRYGTRIALPKGIPIAGTIQQSAPSTQATSHAVLSIAVDRVELDGRAYALTTHAVIRTNPTQRLRNSPVYPPSVTPRGATIKRAVLVRRHVSLLTESVLTFKLDRALAVKTPA